MRSQSLADIGLPITGVSLQIEELRSPCGTLGLPGTVAPFRAWRGSRDLVAQSPKFHAPAVVATHDCKKKSSTGPWPAPLERLPPERIPLNGHALVQLNTLHFPLASSPQVCPKLICGWSSSPTALHLPATVARSARQRCVPHRGPSPHVTGITCTAVQAGGFS